LEILQQASSREYLGLTYLNLGALLSQIGDHQQALGLSKTAVQEIKIDFDTYLQD